MLTKMQAANMAQNSGCTTYIGKGILERPVSSILSNERRHTRCIAHKEPASPWDVWLTDRLQMAGSLVVKPRAVEDIVEDDRGVNASDIVSVQGEFSKGDVLHVFDENGNEIARGLTNFNSQETLLLARQPGLPVKTILGYQAKRVIINANNIVALEDRHLPWDQPTDTSIDVSEVAPPINPL